MLFKVVLLRLRSTRSFKKSRKQQAWTQRTPQTWRWRSSVNFKQVSEWKSTFIWWTSAWRDHKKCLTTSLPFPSFRIIELISRQHQRTVPYFEKYHTKTYSSTFNQWRKRSTGVTLQRRNNTEGGYRKTIIWRQIHHIFFTMDYMYIFKTF